MDSSAPLLSIKVKQVLRINFGSRTYTKLDQIEEISCSFSYVDKFIWVLFFKLRRANRSDRFVCCRHVLAAYCIKNETNLPPFD